MEEGIITEFVGDDMAAVRVDKKSYHVFLNDLEHPYLRWFTNKTTKTKKVNTLEQILYDKGKKKGNQLPQGIYLVFMPVYQSDGFDESVGKLKVYLYNETLGDYQLDYHCKIKNESIFTISTELLAENEFYIHDITFEEAAQNPQFFYRFIDKENVKLDLESVFSLKPKKLYEKINAVRYDNKAFFHFLLIENVTERAPIDVVKDYILPSKKELISSNHFDFGKALKKSSYEVDLHIEKLLPNFQGLGASEILQIQLKECQIALDLAVATHQNALVLIHGVGKGTLKNEIHELLNQTKYVKRYVNTYDSRYGYGATEVFFQY